MKYKTIVWSLLLGILVTAFSFSVEAQELTSEEMGLNPKGMMLDFYNNNPLLIENQQAKLKAVLSFLDANGIKYYDYYDVDQKYVSVQLQVYYEKNTTDFQLGMEVCVVSVRVYPDEYLPDVPIKLYVFGDIRGDVMIDFPPEVDADIFDKTPDITGHTFAGTLRPNDKDIKYVRTSIAMDSYAIQKRAIPVASTTVYHAYVVTSTAFQGKDPAIFKEFQNMIVQMNRLGDLEEKEEEPKENPYKKVVLGAYNAAVAESQKITNGSVFKQLDSIDAENKSLMSQLKEAQAQNNEALYIKAADIYNANNNKLRELIDTPDYKRFNRLAWFANSIKGMMNEGKWKEAHEFIMSSGVAEEFGYRSPS